MSIEIRVKGELTRKEGEIDQKCDALLNLWREIYQFERIIQVGTEETMLLRYFLKEFALQDCFPRKNQLSLEEENAYKSLRKLYPLWREKFIRECLKTPFSPQIFLPEEMEPWLDKIRQAAQQIHLIITNPSLDEGSKKAEVITLCVNSGLQIQTLRKELEKNGFHFKPY